MEQLSFCKSLDHVCAAQWARCVELSSDAFAAMSSDKYLTINYEVFVTNPVEIMQQITAFLGANHDNAALQQACADVRTESVGKGKGDFQDENGELLDIMRPILTTQGYQ